MERPRAPQCRMRPGSHQAIGIYFGISRLMLGIRIGSGSLGGESSRDGSWRTVGFIARLAVAPWVGSDFHTVGRSDRIAFSQR